MTIVFEELQPEELSRIKPSNFPFRNLLSGPARLLYNPR
jgi:hypothetical protein